MAVTRVDAPPDSEPVRLHRVLDRLIAAGFTTAAANALDLIESRRAQAAGEAAEEAAEASSKRDETGEGSVPACPVPSATRYYVVWSAPEADDCVGVWAGSSSTVWYNLQARLRTGAYAGSGAKLRRHDSWESVLAAWKTGGPAGFRPTYNPTIFHCPDEGGCVKHHLIG